MSSVADIIPPLPVEIAKIVVGTNGQPRSRSEVVTDGALSGAEIMLQKLLEIRGEIGGPEKAKAEREATVREFHGAPITYDGFGKAVRRPPPDTIYLIANA